LWTANAGGFEYIFTQWCVSRVSKRSAAAADTAQRISAETEFDFSARIFKEDYIMQTANRMQGVSGSAIRELFKLLGDPNIISFGGGNPAKECFPKEEIRKRVEKAAEILDLTEYLDRKPKALSGGQRQRVAMGRAIVREPKVFLMDEPLSNLDAKLRVQTRTQIAALQRQLGVTTLYVTHDQTEALTMGDRIAVIKLGILQQVGAPTELYDRPANVFVAGFIGSPSMNINTHPVVNGKAKIGEDTVDLPTEAVNKLTAEDNGQIVVGFRPEDASLAAPDEANAFSLKVMNVEDLGSDGYIYGNIITDGSAAEASTMMSDQNKLTTIRVNPRALPKVGDTVKIKIDPSKMHLFAPSTELRLN